MVAWTALLLPALLSAVLVFIASSLIHMVVQWHKSEYRTLPNEDDVRAAIGKSRPSPGKYVLPFCRDAKDMGSPEMVKKLTDGPNVVMYVRPNGVVGLGAFLGSWFAYTLVVSLVVGYVALVTLPAGTQFMRVLQVVGASAWLAYAWAIPSDSIWMGKPWKSTAVYMFDGLIYAVLTGVAFGVLWPAGTAS